MNATQTSNLNSRDILEQKIKDNKLKLWWVVIVLPLRFALAFGAQGITALIFRATGELTPWQSAGEWWIVYGTIIDLGCLLAIYLATRKEGIRLWDLLSFDKSKLKKDLLLGLLFYVIAGAVSFGAIAAMGFIVYGVFPAPTSITRLPLGGLIYSFSIFPIFWAIAEEITYNGYLFPRLEAFTKSTWKAYLIVVPFFMIQHIALPLVLQMEALIYGAFWTLPLVLVIVFLYIRTRRLLPFIIMHYLIEIFALVSALFLVPT
ncbi:MAG: CPBP family glutamic-type intramembrane protease [Candidatus Heimdallarchaeaceae archaeon]|jgi:membrane protease YdiL (CAAX protease family)